MRITHKITLKFLEQTDKDKIRLQVIESIGDNHFEETCYLKYMPFTLKVGEWVDLSIYQDVSYSINGVGG